MVSEFDAAVKDGLRTKPPSFTEVGWERLEERLAFMFVHPGQSQHGLLQITTEERASWKRLKLDPQRMQSFVNSEAYRTWREDLVERIALTGSFDDDLMRGEPFAKILDEWKKACARPMMVREKVFSAQLYTTGIVAVVAGVIALALGLFSAAVVRSGAGEASGSVGLFGALSALLVLGSALSGVDKALPRHLVFAFAALGVAAIAAVSIVPTFVNLWKLRQGRWARRLAFLSIWIASAGLPPLVWAGARDYIAAPSDVVEVFALLLIWIVISLSYAVFVHKLLDRTGRYPQVG